MWNMLITESGLQMKTFCHYIVDLLVASYKYGGGTDTRLKTHPLPASS